MPCITKWVGPIEDPQAEFNKIDKNGGGQVLFGEFCDWAINKSLDLESDDNYDGDDEKVFKEAIPKTSEEHINE